VEELKKVLTTIKAIQDSTVDMEGRYHDLKMRYATLTRYRIEVKNVILEHHWPKSKQHYGEYESFFFQFEEEEIHLLDETWKQWNLLWLHEIKIISKQLDPVKARFKKLAIQQRAKLKADLVYFCKRFYASGGPSPIQWNIDNGFEVLKVRAKGQSSSNLRFLLIIHSFIHPFPRDYIPSSNNWKRPKEMSRLRKSCWA